MAKKKKASESGKFVIHMSTGMIRMMVDIILYVGVVLAVIACSRYAFDFCYQVFGPVAVESEEKGKEVEFYIELGDSTMEVSKKMERNGLIKNDLAFYLKAKLNNANIQPGSYLLKTSMQYGEILDLISKQPEAETPKVE